MCRCFPPPHNIFSPYELVFQAFAFALLQGLTFFNIRVIDFMVIIVGCFCGGEMWGDVGFLGIDF